MKIELLEWDSGFFGMRVGRLLFSKNVNWDDRKLNDWDLVYIFIDPQDVSSNQLVHEKQIPLVDEKITFLMNLQKVNINPGPSSNINSYHSSARDQQVISIGVQSGVYSRFCVDPDIPHEKFKEMYTIWMQKSIKRELAGEVFVFENAKNEIAGVITLGEKNNRADIGILAVDEKFRAQNIGSALVNEAVKYSVQTGYPALQVITQKMNQSACKFYERCGFSEEQVVNIYHYWKKNYDSVQ